MLEVIGLAWYDQAGLLKRGAINGFWIKRPKLGLGQPAMAAGLEPEQAAAHRGLYALNAVIYVCASSASSNARAIVDQIAVCRGLCERRGWAVIGIFDDTSSGSGKLEQKVRSGLRALLGCIEEGGIDYVVIETTDRIARAPGDTSAIQKHIERAGARSITVSDSEGGDRHRRHRPSIIRHRVSR